MGRDVATLFVALSIALVFAVLAYVSQAHPRVRDDRPQELSRLRPPFGPWPSGGVRYA